MSSESFSKRPVSFNRKGITIGSFKFVEALPLSGVPKGHKVLTPEEFASLVLKTKRSYPSKLPNFDGYRRCGTSLPKAYTLYRVCKSPKGAVCKLPGYWIYLFYGVVRI